MKTIPYRLGATIAVFALTTLSATFADGLNPVPLTADQAFDAVTTQSDPGGTGAPVILIDVRDPEEIFFNGAAARVTVIHLRRGKGDVLPDHGKVRLLHEGKFIEYTQDGRYRRVQVGEVEALETEPLAINIPYWLRNDEAWDKETAELDFYDAVSGLQSDYPADTALILYCRTGGRSSLAGQLILNGRGEEADEEYLEPLLFWNVYEIDDPAGTNGRGGFSGPEYVSGSGPEYGGLFNGYAGFPERLTEAQTVPSVSWMDAALPVKRDVIR